MEETTNRTDKKRERERETLLVDAKEARRTCRRSKIFAFDKEFTNGRGCGGKLEKVQRNGETTKNEKRKTQTQKRKPSSAGISLRLCSVLIDNKKQHHCMLYVFHVHRVPCYAHALCENANYYLMAFLLTE